MKTSGCRILSHPRRTPSTVLQGSAPSSQTLGESCPGRLGSQKTLISLGESPQKLFNLHTPKTGLRQDAKDQCFYEVIKRRAKIKFSLSPINKLVPFESTVIKR